MAAHPFYWLLPCRVPMWCFAYSPVIRLTALFGKNINGVNCATNFINCITFIELSMYV